MTERFAPLARLLDTMVARGETPGAAVAVGLGGARVFEHYAGEARTGVAANPQTIWPVASISKLFTAAVVMRLIEQGELILSQRVQTVLPDFSAEGRDTITLRHLMVHMSGLPYESSEMPARMAALTPYDAIVDEAYAGPLQFEPGSRQAYSDFGYAIAGRMASRATGRSFPDLVRELVLEPAGLRDTHIPPPVEVYDRIAYVVGVHAEGTDGAMYNTPYARNLAHPAFGTFATVRDLLDFGLLYAPTATRRIHSPAGLRAMLSDQTGGDFPGEWLTPRKPDAVIHAWGIGWMFKGFSGTPDLVTPASHGHAGASGCILWVDPALDLTVAFVSNRHINLSWDDWQYRIDRAVNVATVCGSQGH